MSSVWPSHLEPPVGTLLVHLGDVNASVFSWPLGQDLDSHRGLHNCLWGDVCKDMEGPRHLQKCENEEEGNLLFQGICGVHLIFI